MKLAVVGAAGLVGRHVRDAARAAGHDVVAIARALPDGRPLDLAHPADPGASAGAHVGGVELARALREVDVVVWAAARPSVEGCEIDPEGTRRVNVDAVRVFLEHLDARVGFLAFSSEYVFDGAPDAQPAAPALGNARRAYLEGDARRALNVYGEQKIALEDLVTARRNGAVLRVSAVFGPEPARKNFVLQLVDAARAGRRVAVANDQWITPTYAPDLGAVVVEVAGRVHEGTFAGVLHTAGPAVLRRDTFAHEVAAALGLSPNVVDAKPTSALFLRAARPAHVGLDTSLLRQLTGSVIRSPLEALRHFRELP